LGNPIITAKGNRFIFPFLFHIIDSTSPEQGSRSFSVFMFSQLCMMQHCGCPPTWRLESLTRTLAAKLGRLSTMHLRKKNLAWFPCGAIPLTTIRTSLVFDWSGNINSLISTRRRLQYALCRTAAIGAD
jgi:hypothetical protein